MSVGSAVALLGGLMWLIMGVDERARRRREARAEFIRSLPWNATGECDGNWYWRDKSGVLWRQRQDGVRQRV